MGWEYSIGFHKKLLSCKARNSKYKKAISRAIKDMALRNNNHQIKNLNNIHSIKGSNSNISAKIQPDVSSKQQLFISSKQKSNITFVDLGSGTGFLSFIAAREGAQRCNLIESDRSMITLSKEIAKQNFGPNLSSFSFVNKDIYEIKKVSSKLKGDIISSETFGTWPFEEGMLGIMSQASKFKISENSIVIPKQVKQFVAPILSPQISQELGKWHVDIQKQYQLNFNMAHKVFCSNLITTEISKTLINDSSTPIINFSQVDFSDINKTDHSQYCIEFPSLNEKVYGLAFWWESILYENIVLSTSPKDSPTHWKQAYLPFIHPIPENTPFNLLLETFYSEGFDIGWSIETPKGVHETNFLNFEQ